MEVSCDSRRQQGEPITMKTKHHDPLLETVMYDHRASLITT